MYDYIIVGGGTAGCVLANRLSANPRTSVLVIEIGADPLPNEVRNPQQWISLPGSSADWNDSTGPQTSLNGRRVSIHAGKGVGGSSLIGDMRFVPPKDIDLSDSVAKAVEMMRPSEQTQLSELEESFLDTALVMGQADVDHFDGGITPGFGRFLTTTYRQSRTTVADAYLDPRMIRSNLTIRTDVRVLNLLLDGNRAAGVRIFNQGDIRDVKATKEVIFCAGTYRSAQLLQLSGYGNSKDLRRLGAPVKFDLPLVGYNLVESPMVGLQFRTQNVQGLVSKGGVMSSLFGRGSGSTGFAVGGYIRSSAELEEPDLEIVIEPRLRDDPAQTGGTIWVTLLDPHSRGSVGLGGTDAVSPPKINLNLLGEDSDIERLRVGVNFVNEMINSGSLATQIHAAMNFTIGSEMSDQDLRRLVVPAGRPAGSCHVGDVVDDQLSVFGLKNVRVADASVLPANGSLAPTVVFAEWAATHVFGV